MTSVIFSVVDTDVMAVLAKRDLLWGSLGILTNILLVAIAQTVIGVEHEILFKVLHKWGLD